MSDYFDRVEQGLRGTLVGRATNTCRGIPHRRTSRTRRGGRRGALGGERFPALAASGVFQTGAPVAPEVAPLASTDVGAPIPSSVRLLALRVADPDGGPPWGLRTIKTTRGLMCVQVGRIVDGRIGVLGRDGAFHDDGRFSPPSIDYLEDGGFNCGTEDGHGNVFLNEEAFGVPADGLEEWRSRCLRRVLRPRPFDEAVPSERVAQHLLRAARPRATSITYPREADGTGQTVATAGPTAPTWWSSATSRRAAYAEAPNARATLRACSIARLLRRHGRTDPQRVRSLRPSATARFLLPPARRSRSPGSRARRRTAFRRRLRERYPAVWRKLVVAEAHMRHRPVLARNTRARNGAAARSRVLTRRPRVLPWAMRRYGGPLHHRRDRDAATRAHRVGTLLLRKARIHRALRAGGAAGVQKRSTCSRADTSYSCSSACGRASQSPTTTATTRSTRRR